MTQAVGIKPSVFAAVDLGGSRVWRAIRRRTGKRQRVPVQV